MAYLILSQTEGESGVRIVYKCNRKRQAQATFNRLRATIRGLPNRSVNEIDATSFESIYDGVINIQKTTYWIKH